MVSGTYFYFQWQPLERKHTNRKIITRSEKYTFKSSSRRRYTTVKKIINKFFSSMGPLFGKISNISESK